MELIRLGLGLVLGVRAEWLGLEGLMFGVRG